jgi:hypothetical protein
MAESLTGRAGKGYQQTIFTRHALAVKEQIELFDSDFEEGLRNQGTSLKFSLAYSIKVIQKIVSELKK